MATLPANGTLAAFAAAAPAVLSPPRRARAERTTAPSVSLLGRGAPAGKGGLTFANNTGTGRGSWTETSGRCQRRQV